MAPSSHKHGGRCSLHHTSPPALFSRHELITIAAQDEQYRLWGFEDGASCAFKDADGAPVFYDGYVKITWEEAPTCAAEMGPSAWFMADSKGELMAS